MKGAFKAENSNCPIESYELSQGEGIFTIEDLQSSFIVTMSPQVVEEGSLPYQYTVQAKAVGGAIATVIGFMDVDDSNPAPVITPDESFESDTGTEL